MRKETVAANVTTTVSTFASGSIGRQPRCNTFSLLLGDTTGASWRMRHRLGCGGRGRLQLAVFIAHEGLRQLLLVRWFGEAPAFARLFALHPGVKLWD